MANEALTKKKKLIDEPILKETKNSVTQEHLQNLKFDNDVPKIKY